MGFCSSKVSVKIHASQPSPSSSLIAQTDSIVNLAHLDHLCEEVTSHGEPVRLVHIYAEAPNYDVVADPIEGTSCIDDVARAAVVYLRHYELHHDPSSKEKTESLLNFILLMQSEDGLYYNFVITSKMDINKDHFRSKADKVEWWTARAIWALATAARVLDDDNPELTEKCLQSIDRCMPHVYALCDNYPNTITHEGRDVPTWLMYEDGADATSELLLGLSALYEVKPSEELDTLIAQLAEGIQAMSFGSMSEFPYGLHASTRGHWHGWGNSQTQALAEAGHIETAKHEADHFYPRLLIHGFLRSMSLEDEPKIDQFDGIAYSLRCVVVGLIRLYEATQDQKYLTMAGLAASWFTGNNESGIPMYDPSTGRCFDGVIGPDRVNHNAGAESTIEALYALLEVEQYPAARRWMFAKGNDPIVCQKNGKTYFYRVFNNPTETDPISVGLVMDLENEQLYLLHDESLDQFLSA